MLHIVQDKAATPREMFQHSKEAVDLLACLSRAQSGVLVPTSSSASDVINTAEASLPSTQLQSRLYVVSSISPLTSSQPTPSQNAFPVLTEQFSNQQLPSSVQISTAVSPPRIVAVTKLGPPAAAAAPIQACRLSLSDVAEVVARHCSNESGDAEFGAAVEVSPAQTNMLEQAMQLADIKIAARTRDAEAVSLTSDPLTSPQDRVVYSSSKFDLSSSPLLRQPQFMNSEHLLTLLEQGKSHMEPSDPSIQPLLEDVVYSSSQDVAGYYEVSNEPTSSPSKQCHYVRPGVSLADEWSNMVSIEQADDRRNPSRHIEYPSMLL